MSNRVMLLSSFLICFSFLGYSQKIEKSKRELDEKSSSATTTSTAQSSNHDGESPFSNVFVEAFLYVGYYSVIGNYKWEKHLQNPLSPYPYCDNTSGNYSDTNSKTIRFDLENNFLFENLGSIRSSYGNHFKTKIRTTQFVYGQLDYRVLFEKYYGTSTTSNLSLLQFNLGYDRLRFKKFNFGFLLGATYVGSGVNKAGINVGLNADAFLLKNLSVNSSMMWSTINSQPVNSFEIKGKYHKKKFFFSVGYENLKIASPNYNYATVGAGAYF